MGAFIGEMLGTMILVLLGNGGVAGVLLERTKAQNSGWIVITAGWCFGVMSGVFVAQATGSPDAHINPAVTVAALLRGLDPATAVLYMLGQFVGAFIGAILVWLAYLSHWEVTRDPDLKLACFSTGPAIRNTTSNLITEAIGTFVLVLVVFSIFGNYQLGPDQNPATNLGPYLVASLVWGIGLSLGGPTGYAINPARDLAPRMAHQLLPIAGKGESDWSYSWIPVVGPIIGAIIAGLLANAVGV
jgi:glycerol uptake facilitator protein